MVAWEDFKREMSAELQMSSAADAVEFPYRAVSSLAIVSIVLGVIALLSGFFFWPGLAMAAFGMAAGLLGYQKIRRFPEEFEGSQIAVTGVVMNLLILLGGSGMHTYIYLTEVPDGYTRVHFWELQQSSELEQPTAKAFEINGAPVFLKGYIHPSSGSGLLKRFILVPDLGTCCFGGQPKSTDMIEVTLMGGDTTKAGLTKKKLAGTFLLNQAPQRVNEFDNTVFYRMQVDQVK